MLITVRVVAMKMVMNNDECDDNSNGGVGDDGGGDGAE